jgi:ATP-dependent DNA helicase RecQ
MIASYFNDHTAKPCGVCDNCLRNKKLLITTEEFKAISGAIKKSIKEKPMSSEMLLQQLASFPENKIWKVLTFLREENIIFVNTNGWIEEVRSKKMV